MTMFRDGPVGPINGGPVTVTASDVTEYSPSLRGLYVGSTGDVAIVFASGESVTLQNLAAGAIHPIAAIKQILATGTTATGIRAFRG